MSASARAAHAGENRGEVLPGSSDAWLYEGRTGETLTIFLSADYPANRLPRDLQLELGGLDTWLVVIAPDGSTLVENDDIVYGALNNSLLANLVLPVNGTYRIEAHGWGNTAGPYTLVIESTLPEETPTPAP